MEWILVLAGIIALTVFGVFWAGKVGREDRSVADEFEILE